MKELVAVKDALTLLQGDWETVTPDCTSLKREALMFGRIAIPQLHDGVFSNKVFGEHPDFISEVEWLLENGVIFEPKLDAQARLTSEDYDKVLASTRNHAMDVVSVFMGFNVNEVLEAKGNKAKTRAVKKKLDRMLLRSMEEIKASIETDSFIRSIIKMNGGITRLFSLELRELEDMDTYPVVHEIALEPEIDIGNSRDEIVEIALKLLPVPDDKTPWERILEFRSDPDSYSKFWALKNWINEVARMQLRPSEIEDKLESLIADYRKHMQLHGIKTKLDSLRTVVLAEAGFITGGWLADLGMLPGIVGMLVTPIFTIKQRQVALLEEEQKAPGREIAYIVKAREEFLE